MASIIDTRKTQSWHDQKENKGATSVARGLRINSAQEKDNIAKSTKECVPSVAAKRLLQNFWNLKTQQLQTGN